MTVNGGLLAVPLALVTVIGPLCAVAGTVAVSCVAVAVSTGVTALPLKVTVLLAAVGLNPVPVRVTGLPGGPLAGLMPVMVNDGAMLIVSIPGRRLGALAVSVTLPAVAAV